MLDDLKKQLRLNEGALQAVIQAAREMCPAYKLTGHRPQFPCKTCIGGVVHVTKIFMDHAPAAETMTQQELVEALRSVESTMSRRD